MSSLMQEWLLCVLLTFTALGAVIGILSPLKLPPVKKVILMFILLLLVGGAYSLWGSFLPWQKHQRHLEMQKKAALILSSVKDYQELIAQLRQKVERYPRRAKGWYLLGRLYTSQGENNKALSAFKKAYTLSPHKELYAVNYAYSLWQTNDRQFDRDILALLQDILTKNPEQPDMLALLALHAFSEGQYEKAIHYWQRLLAQAPPQSEEARSLKKAITKAQEKLQGAK